MASLVRNINYEPVPILHDLHVIVLILGKVQLKFFYASFSPHASVFAGDVEKYELPRETEKLFSFLINDNKNVISLITRLYNISQTT